MVTSVAMLPDEKVGVIVLTNQQEGGAFLSLQNTVLDYYLGAQSKDWVDAFGKLSKAADDRARKVVSEAAGKRNHSKPSLSATAYAGRYRDPWYGDVVVSESGGQLAMRFTHSPLLDGTLEHWQYDTFIARWKDRSLDADSYVTFQLDPSGKVEGVRMKAVSPSTDFSFDFHDLRLSPVAADTPPWD